MLFFLKQQLCSIQKSPSVSLELGRHPADSLHFTGCVHAFPSPPAPLGPLCPTHTPARCSPRWLSARLPPPLHFTSSPAIGIKSPNSTSGRPTELLTAGLSFPRNSPRGFLLLVFSLSLHLQARRYPPPPLGSFNNPIACWVFVDTRRC